MSTNSSPKPLPFPAEEIRQSALDNLERAATELHRLLINFRGKQRATRPIELMQMRCLSLQMSLKHLQWDWTQDDDFDARGGKKIEPQNEAGYPPMKIDPPGERTPPAEAANQPPTPSDR